MAKILILGGTGWLGHALAEQYVAHDDDVTCLARGTSGGVLTGERPTGVLHLGHLFGSIAERVRLQRLGVQSFVILADYQVITDRDTMANVREHVHGAVLDYLAAGLNPEQTTIFTHSSVPALNQLVLPFLSLVTEAELQRNPTVKAELAASGRALSGLLLTYPVHQAADILFCKANLVPVGKDNLPHVEMTRVIARRFNDRYGHVSPEPDALVTASAEVMGLDGRKMSKSYGNMIALSMTADETPLLFGGARPTRTGSLPMIPMPAPASRPSSPPRRCVWDSGPRTSPGRSATAGAAPSRASQPRQSTTS